MLGPRELEKMNEVIEAIDDLAEARDELKPLIGKTVKIAKEFAAELEPIAEGIVRHAVRMKSLAVKEFEENGFSREEAIFLATNTVRDLSDSVKKASRNISDQVAKKAGK